MNITDVAGFAGVAIALIAVPGPDWAFILAAGARDHVVWPAVLGLMTGYFLITAIVVIGIGPLIATWPWALLALTVAGAGYLIYLGAMTLRNTTRQTEKSAGDHGRSSVDLEDTGTAPPTNAQIMARTISPTKYVGRGIAVSGLNPKGILIFVAILPQFAHAESSFPLPVQMAVLGCVYVAITGLFYTPLGFAADRVLGARPGLTQITTRIAGVAMIVVGVALIIERLLV